MKKGIFLMASIGVLSACNNAGSKNDNFNDSLGNKYTDTAGRNDTAYYERLQHKTAGDSASRTTTPRRNDTGYYERLPHKINPPDSGQ